MSAKNHLSRKEFLYLSAVGVAGLVLSGRAGTNRSRAAEKGGGQNKNGQAESVSQEAPELAALVSAGQLPPLSERLPDAPLVLTPINVIGKYGGYLRFLRPAYWGGYTLECMYGHSALRWINDGQDIAPGICDTWGTDAQNKVWTFHLRQGLKWSDGQPCTTADVMYWWEDLVDEGTGPDLVPDFGSAGGQLATFEALDASTLRITYSVSSPLTAKRLAMWVNANIGPRWIAPKHYLSQFHPKYNPSYTDFNVHTEKANLFSNPECPSLNSWVVTNYAVENITWQRNAYYYCIDTVGNQLPYIRGIVETLSTDHQDYLDRIKTGKTDFNIFTYLLNFADIPGLYLAQTQGKYRLELWDSGSGTGTNYLWNYDHPEDKRRSLYRDKKFKRAMSLALDRPTIKAIVYTNYGEITTGTYSSKAIEFNFNAEAKARYAQYRDAYSAYDPAQARTLLDEINVKDVDQDGWREFPDGSQLEVRIDIPDNIAQEYFDVLQIARQNWEAIDLKIVINQMPSGDFDPYWQSGQGEIKTWEVGDGPDHLLYPSWVVPNERDRWAPLCGNTLAVKGTPLENTECGISPWDRVPPRYCSADPEYSGSIVEDIHQIFELAQIEIDPIIRMQYVWQIDDLHMNEGPFFIGTVGNAPRIVTVSDNLENVPRKDQLALGGFCNPWILPYPAITNPETYFFKEIYEVYLPLVKK